MIYVMGMSDDGTLSIDLTHTREHETNDSGLMLCRTRFLHSHQANPHWMWIAHLLAEWEVSRLNPSFLLLREKHV